MGYNIDVNAPVMTKAERIKNTLRETKERRRTQRVFVYELKLQNLYRFPRARLERLPDFRSGNRFGFFVSRIQRSNVPGGSSPAFSIAANLRICALLLNGICITSHICRRDKRDECVFARDARADDAD